MLAELLYHSSVVGLDGGRSQPRLRSSPQVSVGLLAAAVVNAGTAGGVSGGLKYPAGQLFPLLAGPVCKQQQAGAGTQIGSRLSVMAAAHCSIVLSNWQLRGHIDVPAGPCRCGQSRSQAKGGLHVRGLPEAPAGR